MRKSVLLVVMAAGLFVLGAAAAHAATPPPATAATAGQILGLHDTHIETSEAVRIALILTLLTLIPAIAICMTPFIRIVVVLSMIRHAFGMPETPPNQVLVALALFLTAFTMGPTLTAVNQGALQPFLSGTTTVEQAVTTGSAPMKAFMLRQVHDQDIKTVYDIAKQPLPPRAADVGLMQLTTAFMLNELRVSFKIGFVILLPFLLIDLVVSSVLLSLGMLMVPPSTLSLPLKVLMFVLIDGWSLVLQGVVGSFR
ncbi:MAG: flagellar type III secretion system pore protein FliP [Parcubacteria group bacterium]